VDRGTAFWLRVDGKTTAHQFQSLLHAVDTKALARSCRFEVEAHAGIADREMNLNRRSIQLHMELPRSAVLHPIVQGFLQYAEKAKGNVLPHDSG